MIGWLDCSSGVSGDMLLGALTATGALDPTELPARLRLDAHVRVESVTKAGLAATHVSVTPDDDQPQRHLDDVIEAIDQADLASPVARTAIATFQRLAHAEARVHGTTPDDVHFHEVGAVDALIDVVGACLGFAALDLDELVVSPIALGGGTATTAHGRIPVPGPAVLELLAASGLAGHGGPDDVELATPTGVALLAQHATRAWFMPAMTISRVAMGAGSRELERPNVLRLVLGQPVPDQPSGSTDNRWQVVEANVDDLDPRLWPGVLARLLSSGAVDAWLTPIVMKKGRPAHTVSALAPADAVPAVHDVLFAETSTIGLRHHAVDKRELVRRWITVDVGGHDVRIKVAGDGQPLSVTPEFDDVAAAAAALGRPVKDVLAQAAAAGRASVEAATS